MLRNDIIVRFPDFVIRRIRFPDRMELIDAVRLQFERPVGLQIRSSQSILVRLFRMGINLRFPGTDRQLILIFGSSPARPFRKRDINRIRYGMPAKP